MLVQLIHFVEKDDVRALHARLAPEVAPAAEEVDAKPCGREPRREERLSLPWLTEEEDGPRLTVPGEQLSRELAQGRAEASEVRLNGSSLV